MAGSGGYAQRLIHGYHDVNLDIVWETVVGRLPALIRVLDQAVAQA